jgi:hypothetical protein
VAYFSTAVTSRSSCDETAAPILVGEHIVSMHSLTGVSSLYLLPSLPQKLRPYHHLDSSVLLSLEHRHHDFARTKIEQHSLNHGMPTKPGPQPNPKPQTKNSTPGSTSILYKLRSFHFSSPHNPVNTIAFTTSSLYKSQHRKASKKQQRSSQPSAFPAPAPIES